MKKKRDRALINLCANREELSRSMPKRLVLNAVNIKNILSFILTEGETVHRSD